MLAAVLAQASGSGSGSTADVVVAAVLLLAYVATAIICALKGKYLWATLGFVTGWHVVPAIRLAKPGSWWARRFYDDYKLEISKARLHRGPRPHTDLPHDMPPGGDAHLDDLMAYSPAQVAGMDRITRKAWEKERKRRARGR